MLPDTIIQNLFENEPRYNKILEEYRDSLQYPVLDVNRCHHITDLSEFVGNWIRGWTKDPNWINYGLIYNFEIIPVSEQRHPETINFLKQFKEPISMAGFSILKSKGSIPRHVDTFLNENDVIDDNVYHIGLDVPDRCFLVVNGKMYKHNNKECISFKDSDFHSAFNDSDEDRVILYIKFN